MKIVLSLYNLFGVIIRSGIERCLQRRRRRGNMRRPRLFPSAMNTQRSRWLTVSIASPTQHAKRPEYVPISIRNISLTGGEETEKTVGVYI